MDIITYNGKLNFNPINISKKHNEQFEWKRCAILETNDDLEEYYRWFLVKRFNLDKALPSLRGGHVTFINDRINTSFELQDGIYLSKFNEMAQKYDGDVVEFSFNVSNLRSNGEHWWYNIECDTLLDIREEIGFSRIPYFGLHFTIARFDKNHIESYNHSKQILESLIYFENEKKYRM